MPPKPHDRPPREEPRTDDVRTRELSERLTPRGEVVSGVTGRDRATLSLLGLPAMRSAASLLLLRPEAAPPSNGFPYPPLWGQFFVLRYRPDACSSTRPPRHRIGFSRAACAGRRRLQPEHGRRACLETPEELHEVRRPREAEGAGRPVDRPIRVSKQPLRLEDEATIHHLLRGSPQRSRGSARQRARRGLARLASRLATGGTSPPPRGESAGRGRSRARERARPRRRSAREGGGADGSGSAGSARSPARERDALRRRAWAPRSRASAARGADTRPRRSGMATSSRSTAA